MGKIVNLGVCNVQYCAFFENQFHLMDAMLCCLVWKCWLSSCYLFRIHRTKTFPSFHNGSVLSTAAQIPQVDRNIHCLNPQDTSLPLACLPPLASKKESWKNPSSFSRLNQCLQKTFRPLFWGTLWGRVQNKKSRTKDRGNPARGTSHELEICTSYEQRHWLLWFQTSFSRMWVQWTALEDQDSVTLWKNYQEFLL